MPPTRSKKAKGKAIAPPSTEPVATPVPEEQEQEQEQEREEENMVVEERGIPETATPDGMEGVEKGDTDASAEDETQEEGDDTNAKAEPGKRLTMEERKAKMDALRKKIATSSRLNRASLVEESAKAKMTARDLARLEKQRKLAETLRAAADAEEQGVDVERSKNWEWTIEENDNWEKKMTRKARRADFAFHDDAHAARRRYKKDIDHIKPDLVAYNKQKEIALGLAPGSLVGFDPKAGSSQLVPISQEQQQLAAANLYRDANTLMYGDSKPSEDAIDRVVGKINQDIDKKGKFSRKRLNEDEGDITYINEHNRVFNKKIARYYDKYTAEIRASFERGTAL
ncbi:hypothetical protein H0H87_002343 [Tephrocybe sp. NHM501043]|nr:hypothetical protein H0H87_002343 [Tephrocybe sp. NHM501043]